MLNIFRKIYDGLFPAPECVQRIQNMSPAKFHRYYFVQKINQVIALSSFQQEDIRAAITANKFHHHKHAAFLLGHLLATWCKDQKPNSVGFVSVPLSKIREKSRGYNQVTEIIRSVPRDNLHVLNLLKRHKHTEPQTSLPRSERLQNIRNAFIYSEQKIPETIETIVILDDVVTTGATLVEAHKVLRRELGAKYQIICVALAH